MKHICFALLLLCTEAQICVQGHLLSQPNVELLHIQAQEQLISQHNDSSYVQRVMRLAKSAEMRNYMQYEVEACENFYDYTCGNWAKINPANDATPRETNYEQLMVKAYRHKQQRLMEQPADGDTEEEAVLKLKEFYASCLHFQRTPKSAYRQQLDQIVAEFGRMPVLALPGQQWPEEEFQWLKTVAKIKGTYGLDILLSLEVIEQKIYVGQPRPKLHAQAQQIQQQLVQYLGVESDLAGATAQEIVQLEESLSRGMHNRPVGTLARSRTAEELSKAYTASFNLTEYVELILERPLLKNETLYELVPSYQTHLGVIISGTPKQSMANYIFFHLLQHFFYDQSSAASSTEQCMAGVRQHFPELLDHLAYQQYADPATLSDVEELWTQVKLGFRHLLETSTSDWLALLTRRQLMEQLNATQCTIRGHDQVNFTQRYQQLQFKPLDYIFNLRAILSENKWEVRKTTPLTTPSYDAQENLVLLPVALLQPNFLWSRYYPRALRFGSLGVLLAQTLAHSFDDHSGWDSLTQTEFGKRKACFKHQYARLRLGGQYLAESDLQSENMADNVAIQVSYQAYNSYLETLATSALSSESLPLLDHTPRQLFFLSYGQLWCNDVNEQFRDKQSLLNTHTPNALRVLGALSNFEAFAREFSCAPKTPMNPLKKCRLY